jgi:transcriptional regulator with XRE-family HTH domain
MRLLSRPSLITPGEVRRLRFLASFAQGRGLNQSEMAARFGVATNTWSRWELGRIGIHPAQAAALTRALNEQNELAEQRQAAYSRAPNQHAALQPLLKHYIIGELELADLPACDRERWLFSRAARLLEMYGRSPG